MEDQGQLRAQKIIEGCPPENRWYLKGLMNQEPYRFMEHEGVEE